ncbi:unnamed protein product [Mycetohabitans rhizoxinica HKI 454]|uniref:Uncharacterized protein n=1 Tax=Mycetohabitans rhizoxinica (strain DSM 19002 / CIP 109453 / HKI 454) TaxID=882378 RepID=E5ASN9_MYCRK|nr:unnamed protein product [Mycetohabitans rhizoxinica HKI 454]
MGDGTPAAGPRSVPFVVLPGLAWFEFMALFHHEGRRTVHLFSPYSSVLYKT